MSKTERSELKIHDMELPKIDLHEPEFDVDFVLSKSKSDVEDFVSSGVSVAEEIALKYGTEVDLETKKALIELEKKAQLAKDILTKSLSGKIRVFTLEATKKIFPKSELGKSLEEKSLKLASDDVVNNLFQLIRGSEKNLQVLFDYFLKYKDLLSEDQRKYYLDELIFHVSFGDFDDDPLNTFINLRKFDLSKKQTKNLISRAFSKLDNIEILLKEDLTQEELSLIIEEIYSKVGPSHYVAELDISKFDTSLSWISDLFFKSYQKFAPEKILENISSIKNSFNELNQYEKEAIVRNIVKNRLIDKSLLQKSLREIDMLYILHEDEDLLKTLEIMDTNQYKNLLKNNPIELLDNLKNFYFNAEQIKEIINKIITVYPDKIELLFKARLTKSELALTIEEVYKKFGSSEYIAKLSISNFTDSDIQEYNLKSIFFESYKEFLPEMIFDNMNYFILQFRNLDTSEMNEIIKKIVSSSDPNKIYTLFKFKSHFTNDELVLFIKNIFQYLGPSEYLADIDASSILFNDKFLEDIGYMIFESYKKYKPENIFYYMNYFKNLFNKLEINEKSKIIDKILTNNNGNNIHFLFYKDASYYEQEDLVLIVERVYKKLGPDRRIANFNISNFDDDHKDKVLSIFFDVYSATEYIGEILSNFNIMKGLFDNLDNNKKKNIIEKMIQSCPLKVLELIDFLNINDDQKKLLFECLQRSNQLPLIIKNEKYLDKLNLNKDNVYEALLKTNICELFRIRKEIDLESQQLDRLYNDIMEKKNINNLESILRSHSYYAITDDEISIFQSAIDNLRPSFIVDNKNIDFLKDIYKKKFSFLDKFLIDTGYDMGIISDFLNYTEQKIGADKCIDKLKDLISQSREDTIDVEYISQLDRFESELPKKILGKIKENISKTSKKTLVYYFKLAVAENCTLEEAQKYIQEKVEMVARKSNYFKAIHFDVFREVFKSDQQMFKTQFLVHKSNGHLNPEYRSREENKMFGYRDSLNFSYVRPNYGYMSDDENGHSNVGNYGDIHIKLKKRKVEKRSTITFGDSLGNVEDMPPTPSIKPHRSSINIRYLNFSSGFKNLKIENSSNPGAWSSSYVEVQYHWPLGVKDIESIHLSKSFSDIEELKKIIEEYNLKNPNNIIEVIVY